VHRPGLVRYLLIVLAMVLSLLAKPMLVTLPFVLLLLDYWPLGRLRLGQAGTPEPDAARARSLTALLLEKVPLLLLAAAGAAVTAWAQSGGGKMLSLVQHPLSLRTANAVVSYAQYLRQAFWPMDLALFYPFPWEGLPPWQVAAATLLLFGVTTAAVALGRRHPYLLVGWLFYLGTLVPVIGLVQVGHQARADRYTYVPLLGIFLLITWAAAEMCSSVRRRRVLVCLAGVALVLLLVRCRAEAQVWEEDFFLWNHALQSHESKVAYCNRAQAWMRQGKWQAAEKDFEAALRLEPGDADALTGLGAASLLQKQPARAEQRFREALAHHPDSAHAHAHLGRFLLLQGRRREAAQHLQEALRLRPDLTSIDFSLRLALQGSTDGTGQ
jgi:hypothetical protein